MIKPMSLRTKADVFKTAMILIMGVATGSFGGTAQAFPVDSPQSFKNYLNSQIHWNDGYGITIKSVSECYRTYKNNGKVKAYVCKSGEGDRISPKGEKSTCKVDFVRLTRKGKLKLTTANCKYK
mgnify:FL=1